MKDNSLYKFGGIASMLVGTSYVVISLTGILIPPQLGGVPDAQSPFMYWEANKTMVLTQWWAMLIGAVFALAAIPAISATVQHLNEGWVRWATTLAILAFAVVILDNYWAIVYTDARAQAYLTGTAAMTFFNFDPPLRFIETDPRGFVLVRKAEIVGRDLSVTGDDLARIQDVLRIPAML